MLSPTETHRSLDLIFHPEDLKIETVVDAFLINAFGGDAVYISDHRWGPFPDWEMELVINHDL